jgi:hypothetical protein
MSRTHRAGLLVLGILSLLDLAGPAMTDGRHPPMAVAVAGSVIGAFSLMSMLYAWRGDRRALVTFVALRLLSAVITVPAFFISGVPAAATIAAAAIVVVTVVGVVLTLSSVYSPSPVVAG